MTSQIADVTNQATEIELFEDQDMKVSVSQVETKIGPRKAQNLFAVGFVSGPVESDRLIVTKIESALYAIGGTTREIEEALNVQKGERCIFSTDEDGNLLQKLFFDSNGIMSLDDGSDFGVRYGELEAAFDELKTDHNDLVELFNAHIHITTATVSTGLAGVLNVPAGQGSQSSADISDAKVSTFKLQTKAEQDA